MLHVYPVSTITVIVFKLEVKKRKSLGIDFNCPE